MIIESDKTISVIIATKNRPQFLSKALSSVSQQTLAPFEVIVVNDSDLPYVQETKNVVESFRSRIKNLVIVPNRSTRNACGVWNTGASVAKCYFLAFLDDDDKWDPQHLELAYNKAVCADLDLVLSAFYKVSSKGIEPEIIPPKIFPKRLFFVRNIGMRSSNIFIKREIFWKVGGFDERFNASTDRVFGIRLSKLESLKYDRSLKRTVYYYCGDNSRISKKSKLRLDAVFQFYRTFCKEMTNEEIMEYIYRAWRYWDIDLTLFQQEFKIPSILIPPINDPDLLDIFDLWLTRETKIDQIDEIYNLVQDRFEKLLNERGYPEELLTKFHYISRQYEFERELYDLSGNCPKILIAFAIQDRPHLLDKLLESLLEELQKFDYCLFSSKNKNYDHVNIFILENSLDEANIKRNNTIVSFYRDKGMKIDLISQSEQIKLINPKIISNFFNSQDIISIRKSIGYSRMLLTLLLARVANENEIVWMIDDDMQFYSLVIDKNNKLRKIHAQNIFHRIARIRKEYPNISVGIGGYTGRPPLPGLSTITTTLFDLVQNLVWFINHDPDELYVPNLKDKSIFSIPDYYYDLSRISNKHKTIVFPWLSRSAKNNTFEEEFNKFLDSVTQIIHCLPSTRPLILTKEQLEQKNETFFHRGGNTIFFDRNFIFRLPYFSLKIDNAFIRRSEMMWALLLLFIDPESIKKVPIFLYHTREPNTSISNRQVLLNTMIADFWGFCTYLTLNNLLDTVTSRSKEKRQELSFICNFSKEKLKTWLNEKIYTRKNRLRKSLTKAKELIVNFDSFLSQNRALWNESTNEKIDQILVSLNILDSKINEVLTWLNSLEEMKIDKIISQIIALYRKIPLTITKWNETIKGLQKKFT